MTFALLTDKGWIRGDLIGAVYVGTNNEGVRCVKIRTTAQLVFLFDPCVSTWVQFGATPEEAAHALAGQLWGSGS